MKDLNEKLNKSLEEIDQLAEQIISKSETTETVETAEAKTNEEVVAETAQAIEKGLKSDDVAKDADEGSDTDKGDEGKEEDKGEDKEDKETEDKDDVQKSLIEQAEENETLVKGFEVSEFLHEFTRLQGTIVDGLREDVNKSLESNTHTATILAKSFNAIMKSQGALAKSIDGILERLDQVERQPVGRKAVVNVVEKSFNHSAGVEEPTKELSKGEKLAKLTDMAMNGTDGVTINDVVSYESTGQLRPELEALLKN
ncbi:hypothetical protein M3_0227 [Lysinibacillus phage vB_LfM_LysYB1]|nr:hypothetical protein M3_0227 [Lysinibacillus phage vB_LfM_LysYB1]WAB25261.1 hypothetical protein M5_0083 [Lysinibacillus phage vB_LfM_LysYB2]